MKDTINSEIVVYFAQSFLQNIARLKMLMLQYAKA